MCQQSGRSNPHYQRHSVIVVRPDPRTVSGATIDESGLKGYDVTHWYGPFAPAATPRDIVNRLHNELAQALRSPETVARIAKQGAEPGNMTLEQLVQFMRGETVKWSKAVKASGAKVE